MSRAGILARTMDPDRESARYDFLDIPLTDLLQASARFKSGSPSSRISMRRALVGKAPRSLKSEKRLPATSGTG